MNPKQKHKEHGTMPMQADEPQREVSHQFRAVPSVRKRHFWPVVWVIVRAILIACLVGLMFYFFDPSFSLPAVVIAGLFLIIKNLLRYRREQPKDPSVIDGE